MKNKQAQLRRSEVDHVHLGQPCTAMTKKSPSATDKHVGARIRSRRLMLNMSQTALGNGLDVSFQQVQKYEKGSNRVGASRLQQIAHILQVPVAFFFEGAPAVPGQKPSTKDIPSPSYVTEFISSAEGIALMNAFTTIKDGRLRRSIVRLVREVAQGPSDRPKVLQ